MHKKLDETQLQEDLKKFLFKQELSTEQVESLTGLVEYQEFQQGDLILQEGSTNGKLLFLLEGQVGVVRDNERIAVLNTPGDILGEMSLLTQKPCSATNVAETKASFFVLEVAKINELPDDLRTLFSEGLNRLFSVILANRLASMNEKAKLFEITNRELQRIQEVLAGASKNKIDELTSDHRRLVQKLCQLVIEEEPKIKENLEAVKSIELARPITASVERLMSELRPLVERHQEEDFLSSKRVLLAEDDLNEQIYAKMSLNGTGADLTVAADAESLVRSMKSTPFDLICLNASMISLLEYVKQIQPNAKYVFMTSESISEHIKTLKARPALSAIVVRHPKDHTFTIKNTSTTIRKLLSPKIFGAEQYLSWGTELKELPIRDSRDRPDMIKQMEDEFVAIGIRSALIRRCTGTAEELLMNAIYDAPAEKGGRSLYNHLDRTVPVTLRPEHQGRFRFGCDGSFLAVSVEDPFGGLSRETILNYLERCFAGKINDGIENKGGGGSGLYYVINSSSLTIFNVKPNVRTEVIALFNLNIQINKITTHPSFHFFES